MANVMVQFQYTGSAPTVEDVARKFDIRADLIDSEFGVIATDPQAGLYTILVDQAVAEKLDRDLKQEDRDEATGSFANPKIEPFGPPQD
jgi:hypothetical protein